MASIYTHRDANIRKTWVLMLTFFIVVIGLGWAFSWVFGNQLILYGAVAFALVMNIVSYWNSDKIALAASGAKQAEEGEFQELHRLIENLSITAGLPKPRVYVIADAAPNAFATGRDPKHAAVAVTTGLLQILNRAELEGVIAHELSHIGNRDMLVATVAVVLVGFVTLLSDFFLRWSLFGGMGNGDRDARLQLIMTLVGIALAILAPLIATLMHLAISRKREFLADASSVLLTRYPDGLAAALQKIGAHSQPMRRANHATAHLFLSNPFGKGKAAHTLVSRLFATHPPIEARIAALRGGEKMPQ